MTGPTGRGALEGGLAVAATPLEALRFWTRTASPSADLVASIDAVALCPSSALRRQGAGWLPIALPPVHLSAIPGMPHAFTLADGRRDALDDLLFSLGLDQVLVLPLAPEAAGALLLARSERPFEETEAGDLRLWAAPLGPALSQLARKRRAGAADRGAAREITVLFDLARDLANAASGEAAVRAASLSLHRLLRPGAGAIVLRSAADEGPAGVMWPDGPAGREAVTTAAAVAGMAVPERLEIDPAAGPSEAAAGGEHEWFRSASDNGAVGIALSWAGPVPEPAVRIASSVQASLALAAARLAAQRQREEDRLRAVVEGLPHGVLLLAPDGRIRLVNPAARAGLEAISAWPGDGERLERVASADLRPLIADARRGLPARVEIFVAPGGRTLEIQAVPAGQPAAPGDEAHRDVLLVLEDVTVARRQKAQLARAEKLSALGVLISGIVHEINNPLATILGYAQMLAGSPQAAQRERWIATLEEEAQRCQRIVGNLLAFARPQEPGRRLVALGPIAEKALSLVAYPFRQAGIEAVLRASPDTPAVEADPDAMLQLLINLLTNALHAMEGHDGQRQVRVGLAAVAPGRVEITVKDTGPGIAPEHIDRVFDPFFTTKPEGKGTGLGLSLVAATVRDHGGLIEVESAPGQGALFRILLPANAQDAPARERSVTGPVPLRRALSGRTVLVVDDEPAVAGLLAEILEQAGARAIVEPDAHLGLERLLEAPPDAVIWDLSMAALPGQALLEELGRTVPAAIDRVIFASGDLVQAVVGDPSVGGTRPVLRKPFDLAVVIKTVAATCRGEQPPEDGTGKPAR